MNRKPVFKMTGTGLSPRLDIARPGYDVESADPRDLIFSSRFKTPKIYALKKFVGNSGTGAGTFSEAHGLTYPPMAMSYTNFSSAIGLDKYGASDVVVNDTNIYGSFGNYDTEVYVALFIEPLNEDPETNVAVETAQPKQLIISTGDYDTLKIARTGTLRVSLPSETLSIALKTYTDSEVHGLDYEPMFFPMTQTVNLDLVTTNDIILNDVGQYSTVIDPSESARVYIDDTNITLDVRRLAGFTPYTFPAHDVIFYYTVFYNKIREEFNFLDS